MGDFIRAVIIVKLRRSARKIFGDRVDVRRCCWLKKRGCWGGAEASGEQRGERTMGDEFAFGVGEGGADVRMSGAKRSDLGIAENKKRR